MSLARPFFFWFDDQNPDLAPALVLRLFDLEGTVLFLHPLCLSLRPGEQGPNGNFHLEIATVLSIPATRPIIFGEENNSPVGNFGSIDEK
jgi:hypothetical protein